MRYHREVLREEEPDPTGGGGDPPAGDPPKDSPKEPDPVATIPVSALPEELRGKPEAEIQFTLGRMISSITSANETNRELRARLEEALKAPEPEPEPDPNEGKTVAELFDAGDHEGAFDLYLKKKGYVEAVTGTLSKVAGMEYESVRRELPDFDEYRDDIDSMLKGRGDVDATVVRGAYTMARGNAVIAAEEKVKRALNSPEIPSGDPPEKPDEYPELVGVEKEMFEAEDIPRERWEQLKGDDFDIKVPLSAGSK